MLILACHLTFTVIFYYHVVMHTFIQWKETISDPYLTDTPSCFPFIEPNICPLPQGSLASIPSNAKTLSPRQSLCTKTLPSGQNRESKAPPLGHNLENFTNVSLTSDMKRKALYVFSTNKWLFNEET